MLGMFLIRALATIGCNVPLTNADREHLVGIELQHLVPDEGAHFVVGRACASRASSAISSCTGAMSGAVPFSPRVT